MLRYILLILFLPPWTVFWALIAILGRLLTNSFRPGFWVGRIWSRGILWVARVKLRVSGLERLEPGRRYIFIANHTSAFDIPALYAVLPGPITMLAKKELRRVPIFGWAMWAAGHFFVDRKRRDRAVRSMEQVTRQIQRSIFSLVVFPEGTRSLNGQLQPFKKGAFVLSCKTGIPIVPIVINGAFRIKSKYARRIRPGTIRLEILSPLDPARYGMAFRQQYLEEARRIFTRHYQPPI